MQQTKDNYYVNIKKKVKLPIVLNPFLIRCVSGLTTAQPDLMIH